VINTHDEQELDTPRALDMSSYNAMDVRSYADTAGLNPPEVARTMQSAARRLGVTA
jgi:hypothetical protein